MSDIASLIARLEAATGPSRKLDGDIAATLRIPLLGAPDWLVNWDGDFGADAKGQVACLHSDGRRGVNWSPPYLTSLIDDALRLVPEGHRWLIDRRPMAAQRTDGYRAQVYREAHAYASDMSDMPTAWAATPALALCIAALRAKAAQQ